MSADPFTCGAHPNGMAKRPTAVYWRMIRSLLVCILGMTVWIPVEAQVSGCTDPLAQNYDPLAVNNDGSCVYAAAGVSPYQTLDLPSAVSETSGLIDWDGAFWTHNDDTDVQLYALDPADASISQECLLAGVINQDWEDIDQDDAWIYIGDFGNNSSGNRQDLHILRIEKASLCSGQPQIDTLWFSYEDQTDFGNQGSNNTNYDCEAMIVGTDSIYLFTKQWKGLGTSVYGLPKTPGDHSAEWRSSWPVNGLITGATWLEEMRLVVLSGYSALLQPFVFLCYDYPGHDFFSGNKRRLEITLPFHQVEGITTTNGLDYALTNERFSQIVMVPPRLHRLDLEAYLSAYLDGSTSLDGQVPLEPEVIVTVEGGRIVIQTEETSIGQPWRVMDLWGHVLLEGVLHSARQHLESFNAQPGWYVVQLGHEVYKVWCP